MKFMLIANATKDSEAGAPPDPRLMTAIAGFSEEMAQTGMLISTGGLAPSSMGAKVRVSGGKVVVSDGPFTETKEIVGGYAIVDVSSKEEAIAVAKRFWQLHVDVLGPSYEGGGEIRQVFYQEQCGPQHQQVSVQDSPNIGVVRRLYDARGNPEVIRQVLASDVRWEVVDGFPYGGIYVGIEPVLNDFFGRLFTDFDEFAATGTEFFESGERVIALGNYSGRARKSGKRFTARFAHVWTLQDGRIVRLQQCADTVQLARALSDGNVTKI